MQTFTIHIADYLQIFPIFYTSSVDYLRQESDLQPRNAMSNDLIGSANEFWGFIED